ncbi:hypothetical protein CSA_024009 [Cucumis sativus]|uniref:Uncharacterized protein n=1 Tax=Cucumis sativus TaxID=3659 RepID=A0ACB6HBV9_CUCSA|nr:hypothetical protein CSA_024009 [Cucumis sativus]
MEMILLLPSSLTIEVMALGPPRHLLATLNTLYAGALPSSSKNAISMEASTSFLEMDLLYSKIVIYTLDYLTFKLP